DLPETARYQCAKCEKLIEEHHKTAMLAAGAWHPTVAGTAADVRGYHLSGLYSPLGWLSCKTVVTEFLAAKENHSDLRVWINQRLGETWKEKGDAPEWEALYRRREEYRIGTVPPGAIVLTAGVDVQQDRIELEVVGWGRGLESWSIYYAVIPYA